MTGSRNIQRIVPEDSTTASHASAESGLRLMKAFVKIADAKKREALIELAEFFADGKSHS